MDDALYSREVLRKTTQIAHLGRLAAPQGSAHGVARLCGSTMQVDVVLKDGVFSEFAVTPKACALGQASAAILSQSVIGSSVDELQAARDALLALLKGEPIGFPPRFADLKMLQSVRDFPARHDAVLLPWQTTLAAVDNALQN